MKKLLLFCLLVGLTSFNASAQYFQWAKKQENAMAAISVASGNSLVATTGTFFQTITLGNQSFTAVDSMDNYLAVHDHAGNVLWAKHILSGTSFGQQPAVTLDPNQNVIIAGYFVDSLFIDGLIFKGTAANASGAYVAKFSPTGTLLWAQSSDIVPRSWQTFAIGKSITTDDNGNIFVAGDFNLTVAFGSTNLTSNLVRSAYLVKYNASGALQWAITTPSTSTYENVSKAKASPTGEIYLLNQLVNPGVPGGNSTVLYKFNSMGTLLWNKTFNNSSSNYPNLALDNLNNAYIIGHHEGSITIGGTTLTSNPNKTNLFAAKADAAGNWKWARTVASDLNSSNMNIPYYAPGIVYTNNNELVISGNFSGSPQFGNITITSSSTLQNTYVAKLDTAGTPIWVNKTTSGSGNDNTDLSGNSNNNLFIAGYFYGNTQFSATSLTTSGAAGYLAKITHEANIASGTVFLDANSNGIKDVTESGYEQVILQSNPGSIYGISNPDGTYNLYLPTGANTVSLPSPPAYYTAVPVSHSVTFNGSNQAQSGKDFALQPIPNSNDVKITVTAPIPARPGFQSKYRLTFHNSGTTTLSDTIKFQHNTSTLTFVASSEPTVSNSNGKIAWYYQNLQPNETRNIDVTFSVPNTAVLGTSLTAIASIKPYAIDLLQEDNIDSLHHVVQGSFDPNDKQVDKSTLSLNEAANGEYLDYTIRFQNTGTDTAFTVVVTDRISSKLNLSNFEMLSASHNYKLNVIDGNMLEWRFDNILLPDSNRNEPASHGFIRFRIKSKAGLVLGDSITNQAAIYFDYNAPVITNFAVTKVANPMSVKESKTNLPAFKLYPNPAKNYVMVAAQFRKNTPATVSLINLLGQTLSKVTLPANNQIHYQLPLKELPKGIYLIRLETEIGIQTQRLVVQ